jgi:hypothetical protein
MQQKRGKDFKTLPLSFDVAFYFSTTCPRITFWPLYGLLTVSLKSSMSDLRSAREALAEAEIRAMETRSSALAVTFFMIGFSSG